MSLVFDAIRTPRGRAREDGALRGMPPLELLGGLFSRMRERHSLDTSHVDGALIGCVTQTGDQGGNIGQTAMLHAGWTDSGSVTMVNSFCTSGLTAAAFAVAKSMAGQGDLFAVGGVECMSRVPMASDNGPLTADPAVSRAIPFIPNPVVADYVASVRGYTRADIDEYSSASHRKAGEATAEGRFRSLVPVEADGRTLLASDEAIRAGSTPEAMARLQPLMDSERAAWADRELIERFGGVERVDHIHHAGAAPAMVDGASLALVGTAEGGRRAGLRPRARIWSTSSASGPAALMLTGGKSAAAEALRQGGMVASDIDLWEFNEGFAAIAMDFAQALDVPPDRFNVNGGGIAMGHAMGATGVNLIGTMIDELERRDLETGLIAISGATGVGGAMIIERIAA